MHIDYKKFVELLVDASGIEEDKIVKQITTLVDEINQAIEDGEAYSIDGFGIFSCIGNRMLFIPSKELETEINFKYVGMEPIELEVEQKPEVPISDDDPFSELQDLDEEPIENDKTTRDRFAGLIDDFDDIIEGKDSDLGDEENEEFTPGPKEWGIDAHKETTGGADKLLASLMGESYSDDENDSLEEDFDDIFGDDSIDRQKSSPKEEINSAGLDEELSSLMADDSIDGKSDVLSNDMLDDDIDDVFSELETEENDPDAFGLDVDETEELPEMKEINEDASNDDSLDDFDDPFRGIEDDFELEDDSEQEDIIPVITNISSNIKEKPKEKPSKKEEIKKQKKIAEPQPIAAWVWVLLAITILAGITAGLGYFKVINIPGITPKSPPSTIAIVPQQVPETPEENAVSEQPILENDPTESASTGGAVEQVVQNEVPETNIVAEVPVDQNKYGLNGVVNEAANDGFTIVLFSLSVKENAMAKQVELTNEGFRALVTPISSERFGTLWRVSIGQFSGLADAADAAQTLSASYKKNYFIKRIIN